MALQESIKYMPYCKSNSCSGGRNKSKSSCGPNKVDSGCGSVQLDERYLDIEITKGTTFSLEFCYIDLDVVPVLEVLPSAIEAQLNFASNHCFAVGDKVRLYDHEPRCEAWSLNDVHTVVSVIDNRSITIDSPFFDPQAQSFASQTSFVQDCNKASNCAPQVVKLNDLTGFTFYGKVMNRYESERVSVNLKAQVNSGSALVRIEPAGKVVAGDLMTIAGTDLLDAKVLNVIREAGYDIVELDRVSNISNACCPAAVKPGCLTRMKFDTTNAACGCITAYIECTSSTAEEPVGSGQFVDYTGTQDIPLVGTRSEDCDCYGNVTYDIGYYDIIAVAPASAGATYTQKDILLRGKVKLIPTVSSSLI
jgi:hypothetical protein